MSIVAPGYYFTPASPVVVEQITRLNKKADDVNELAMQGIENLTSIGFAGVALDPRIDISDESLDSLLAQLGDLPDFDPNADWLAGLGLAAGDDAFAFNPEIYQYLRQTLPEYNLPPIGTLPPAPAPPPDPGAIDTPQAPDRPVLPQYTAPSADLDTPAPTYDDYTSQVPFPTLRPINLPPAPVIDTSDIVFEGVRPKFDATPPDPGDFTFAPAEYQAQILDETKAKILEIFAGGTGLPPAVENALFERAREREVELGDREVEQARDDWGARGWKYPPGMLNAATQRARKQASDKISQLNREQFIESWRLQLDMLKTALASAMALEEVSVRVFTSAEELRLQAAKMKVDIALQVFNAFVSRFQAEAQLYAIDAQVFNQKFQAAMAKLQLYSEQLRAASLIGELNKQDVEIFAQRLGALQVNADIYRAKVEGFKALYDAINAKVAIFRAQLDSNNTLVSGYEADVRAFVGQVEAASQRDQRFKIRADIHATNTDAWRTMFDKLVAEQNTAFKAAELRRDTFAANTDRVRAFVEGEQGRINAIRDKYAALASEIGAKSDVEKARYTLMLSLAQAKIARYESAAQILLKNGEINIQSGLTAESLSLRAHETATNTAAQLAAGYTSAANVSAHISDSSASGISYNFSGELDVE